VTATYSLVLAAAGSILVALFLTPLFRNLAIHFGLLDHPDQHRKTHTHAVPRVGGIPIFIAYFASVAIVFFFPVRVGHFIPSHLNLVWKLFPAAALVFAVGLLDDIGGLKPWQKLAGQLAGAVTAFLAGVHLDSISGQHLNLWLALAVTVAWIVICTNAFNLIDGVDGLAAGVGLFATITTLIAALLKQNIPLAMATIPLAGALLGFLRYNFRPWSG
jgi:UDP-GlcNAc:undecaprenyl-phosphate GlcNAc-1-phosphate transferase